VTSLRGAASEVLIFISTDCDVLCCL